MKYVSLIRFATYVLLLAALYMMAGWRYVIPVRFGMAGRPFEHMWDPEEDFHGGDSPSGRPGFADTQLSGKEVLRHAEDEVRRHRIALTDFHSPLIDLEATGHHLEWRITWVALKPPLSDGTVVMTVFLDDATGAARIEQKKAFEPAAQQPNQRPEPTARTVTPRAGARVAPAPAVAHP